MDRNWLFDDSLNLHKQLVGVEFFHFAKFFIHEIFFIARHQGKHTKLMLHSLDNSCKSRLNYITICSIFFVFVNIIWLFKKKKDNSNLNRPNKQRVLLQNFGKTFPRKKCKIDHMFGSESLKSRHFFSKVKIDYLHYELALK